MIGPYAAPKIAERFGAETTFLVAARATLAAIGVLAANRGALGRYGVARASPAV